MNNRKNLEAVEQTFQIIDINDLPKISPWPSRLLGLSEWQPIIRNTDHILREYTQKWTEIFDNYKKQPFQDVSEALSYLSSLTGNKQMLFHIGEDIYTAENSDTFWEFAYSLIMDVMHEYVSPDDTIVELGCGWGRNLFHFLYYKLAKTVIGGEYTSAGVEIGNHIARQFNLPATFFHFDVNNPNNQFLGKLENCVIFTHNAIEQIAIISKTPLIALSTSKPKVVIHFEPVYEYRNNQSLLHYLWKKYAEINGYNKNLLTILKTLEAEGVLTIELEKVHAFGLHALNPGSFIVWKPVK